MAGLLLAGSLLAGCGVPLESEAQRLPPDAVPGPISPAATTAPATPSPTASTSATSGPTDTAAVVAVRLWFVGEDGLESVPALVPSDATAETLLELLAAVPTGVAARGLRTVVPDPTGSGALVVGPTEAPGGSPAPAATSTGVQTVRLSEAFAALPPPEQVLLLGQVVLTLTGAGATAVQITDAAGTPLAVPLPDGRLLDRPATAEDFRDLVAPS